LISIKGNLDEDFFAAGRGDLEDDFSATGSVSASTADLSGS